MNAKMTAATYDHGRISVRPDPWADHHLASHPMDPFTWWIQGDGKVRAQRSWELRKGEEDEMSLVNE